jgi:hypothetical protein
MKVLTGAALALLFALVRPPIANVAEVEPFGRLGASIGAERETGEPIGHSVGRAGARVTLDALGVIPFAWQNFGLQGSAQYVGGQGSRFGGTLGPVYAFDGGKTGFFLDYQHRTVRDADFFWLNPALSLYFNQMNLNLSYAHPISGVQKDTSFPRSKVDVASNKLQATVSYFPAFDMAFVRKDNLEFTFGVQVNAFAGHDANKLNGAGVGPVFGVAMMPWPNMEVNLLRATFDNRSRYKVDSGISFFFSKGANQTLIQLRRKYLETDPPVGAFTRSHS